MHEENGEKGSIGKGWPTCLLLVLGWIEIISHYEVYLCGNSYSILLYDL